jgi:enoyl-CoA hydratase/carnithine racemase
MDYSKYSSLKVTLEDSVLTVAFDRPEVHNAINREVHAELATIFIDADLDTDVDVVVFAGTENAFSAGGDFDWLRELRANPVAAVDTIRNDRRIQNALLDLEKPIIAKVRGAAIGLGCSLALFCDFVYATPEARFSDPHVSVGLVAGDGGAVIWPQLIGYARARRYLLTGDPISGADAAEMGLITEAVPADELDEVVAKMVKRMRDSARYALRWTKASINAELKQVANTVMDRAAGYELMTQTTMEDHGIALDALQAKERPKFTGR